MIPFSSNDNNRTFSWLRLSNAVNYFKNRGHENIIAFLPLCREPITAKRTDICGWFFYRSPRISEQICAKTRYGYWKESSWRLDQLTTDCLHSITIHQWSTLDKLRWSVSEREGVPSERSTFRWFIGLFFNMPLTTMVLWSVTIIFVICRMKRPSNSLLVNGNEFFQRYSRRAIILFPFLHSDSFHLPRSMIPSCLPPTLWVEMDRILMNFFPKFPRMKIVVSEQRR